MGRVVVHDHVDLLVLWNNVIDGAQELQPFLMAVPVVAHGDHLAFERVEGREQRGRAVALVAVSYTHLKHTRRLLLPGDEIHPERTGKIFPEPGEVPEKYLPLLEWARERYEKGRPAAGIWADDPDERVRQLRGNSYVPFACFGQEEEPRPRHLEGLLQARGIGAEMAKGIDPDDYIRGLREGWE